tara:strand:+ start:14086 stop:14301 length:216 start_codon:yes stop_codon:yes gene_type:complete
MLHKHDEKWFKEQIAKLPAAYVAQAYEGYQSTWETAYEVEPVDHRKQNAARRAANTRLREFVERVLKLKER